MPLIREPIRVMDGIAVFSATVPIDHPDYDATGFEQLYAAEKKHFWFITRRNRILDTFSQWARPACRVLEVGAGTGFVAQGLQEKGYRVAVAELHLSGLHYAMKNGISECYQFDLFDPPFLDEFEAIGMFDVIEHLENDLAALEHASKMLKPGGKLFITVPAHNWLWSRSDSVAAHKRRYTKNLLSKTIEQAGLHVAEVRYFFIFVVPLLFLRRLLNPDNDSKVSEQEKTTEIQAGFFVNKILLGLMWFENIISRWLPNFFGGSLIAVAIKK